MIIKFSKFHGAGNDFIVIDNRTGKFNLKSSQIKRICDRRYSVGADGVILFNGSKKYDFEMKYYNADGFEGSMCGNAGRCITAFADYLGLEVKNNAYRFKAVDGIHHAQILNKENFLWAISISMIDVKRIKKSGNTFFVDTGSPHHIEFVEKLENYDVFNKGKLIRYSKNYHPKGTNVNFANILDNEVYIRTYERGVEDETLACGTGVTAVALATAVLNNKCPGRYCYKVHARGGDLTVSFERKNDNEFTNISLSGPAQLVFTGTIDILFTIENAPLRHFVFVKSKA